MSDTIPDSEDPFEYVSDTLIVARDEVNDAQNSIDVGPTGYDMELFREDHAEDLDAIQGAIQSMRDRERTLVEIQKLAEGADESYESLNTALEFLSDVSDGMGELDPTNEKVNHAGTITVEGTEYEVRLVPVGEDE